MGTDIDVQIEALRAEENLPRHIAIIMDGNGRWATKRRLPRLAGHRAGTEPVRKCVRACARIGIEYLTLYTFSIENWNRPRAEVAGLMMFLQDVLRREELELNENNVRLGAIGRLDLLPDATRRTLDETIERLSVNTGLRLTLALSYSGRGEILDATRSIARRVSTGELSADAVDEAAFQRALYDPGLPDPDLLIRTSGEMRVSNFMLWQIAYSEIWVTDVLWPDFAEGHLIDGIRAYQSRDRRYGRHS
ncbi:MAG TPA: isoprenyl transferase [Candidatus Krumholzibacteria bacterium]|nr:isoprenyl transferase [Candidatus Krumholzibacteria bacterium]